MVDTKIKDLTAKTTVVASDEFAGNDVAGGDLDKKYGADDIKTYMSLSPTLITPALGTPASGVLTNVTGLPEAGLLDNAVTLDKMAGGTDGNLITYDTSGDPAAVATGTAAQVLTSNGAGAAPTFQAAAGGGGGFTVVVKPTDETISSDSTLSDDSALKFNVNASKAYAFMAGIYFVSDITPDIKFDWAVPTSTIGRSLGSGYRGWSTTEGTTTDLTAQQLMPLGGTNEFAIFPMGKFISSTTTGEIVLQWAQGTSDAGNTTVKAGSWLAFKETEL